MSGTVSEHTPSPIPWDHIESCEHHGAYVMNGYGGTVCDLYAMSDPSSLSIRNGGTSKPIPFTDADANAKLIVQAVNSHADLMAALTDARKVVVDCIEAFDVLIPATEFKGILTKIDAALDKARAS